MRTSSIREKPRSGRPRRLVDWVRPTNGKKVHSLVDKIYKQKNLEMAWKRVKKNKGAGGIDGQSIEEFEDNLRGNLEELQDELYSQRYTPQPVKQCLIPKLGQPGKYRPLGVPTIKDRVCQQAILNRLQPIFDPMFDEASFGYREGRSTKDALRKLWREIKAGQEWIVDADLRDFFGSADHEKLMALLNQSIADGRVLALIKSMLEAGCIAEGRRLKTEQGVAQGSVLSPLL
jgi:RNA-directed DNA polymerase